jgi:hypothetical protein
MKKNMMVALSVILSGLMASQASFAGYPDKYDIEKHCQKVTYSLNQLLEESNPKDRCAGDITLTAAYFSAAELKVNHKRFDEALISLHYGENVLKGIADSRADCRRIHPSLSLPSLRSLG